MVMAPKYRSFWLAGVRVTALAVIAIIAFWGDASAEIAAPPECETTFLDCVPEEFCTKDAACEFGWEGCLGSVVCVEGPGCPEPGEVALICEVEEVD